LLVVNNDSLGTCAQSVDKILNSFIIWITLLCHHVAELHTLWFLWHRQYTYVIILQLTFSICDSQGG